MNSKVKDPPSWQNGTSYEDYKKEIEVWQLLKCATKKEEGPLIFRSLSGSAKAAAHELTVEEIGSEQGLQNILAKLDKLYLADKNQRIYVDLDAFEKFKRPSSMTMSSFILEFERLHTKVQRYECKYPDGVLAYKVLQAAQLSSEHEKLCKATITTGQWSYASMKEQIKKIFSDITPSCTNNCDVPIKVEQTLFMQKPELQRTDSSNDFHDLELDEHYTDDHNVYYGRNRGIEHHLRDSEYNDDENDAYYGKFRNNYRGSSSFNGNRRGSGRPFIRQPNYQRGNNSNSQGRRYINVNIKSLKDSYDNSPNAPNPKDDRGNITTCRKCRSIYHWMQDCPHVSGHEQNVSPGSKVYYGNDSTEDVFISLFQTSIPATTDEVLCLVGETLNMAVIDSGCPRTVCGKKWYDTYVDSMSEDQKTNLKCDESNAVFRFGDSSPLTSMMKVFLPVTIKDKNLFLPTDVVDADVPFLLSKEALKRGKAITNFENETIQIYDSEQPLLCTTSGHYAIPIKPHSVELTADVVMLVIKEDSKVKVVAKKLHHQFGHPSAKRLINLVKNSGEENEELFKALEEVGNSSDFIYLFIYILPLWATTV